MDAEAQARINEIRHRNRNGSMEQVPGFNLSWNDRPPAEPPKDEIPTYVPTAPVRPLFFGTPA